MHDTQDLERLLRTHMNRVPPPSAGTDDGETLAAALAAMHMARRGTVRPRGTAWHAIVTGRIARLAAAAGVVGAVAFAIFNSVTEPAWALEDAIAALERFHAVHVSGAFPGGTVEIWMRADAGATHSTDVVVRWSGGPVTWTKDGSTYHYEPSQGTVYFEPALTVGLSQWLGPELLDTLSAAENAKITYGRDPATGRDRVTLTCSLIDAQGAHSWVVEFDSATKLPVAFTQWPNLDRSGPPGFEAFKIVYHESLPDDLFDVHVPGGVKRVEKPLEIPGETVGVLGNPADGIPAEGMTQQEAAEKTVRALYGAVIRQDLAQLKTVCPLCRNLGDQLLRTIILKPGKDDRIVEILEVGQVVRTGRSVLGPIVAIPTTVRLENGKKVEEKMIVQFRQFGDALSCVVHGPYGLPREIR